MMFAEVRKANFTANDVGQRPMMTASPNDAWLRHILWQTSHHCATKWRNIILSVAKNIISPQGDASFDILTVLCYNESKKGGGNTVKKHSRKAIYAFFIIAYAIFLSIGMECLLNLLGVSFAISLDGRSVVKQYPRFIPFCVIIGIVALTAIILVTVLNIKISEKIEYNKKIWYIQYVLAFVISIPLLKIWEILFEFLQKTF